MYARQSVKVQLILKRLQENELKVYLARSRHVHVNTINSSDKFIYVVSPSLFKPRKQYFMDVLSHDLVK